VWTEILSSTEDVSSIASIIVVGNNDMVLSNDPGRSNIMFVIAFDAWKCSFHQSSYQEKLLSSIINKQESMMHQKGQNDGIRIYWIWWRDGALIISRLPTRQKCLHHLPIMAQILIICGMPTMQYQGNGVDKSSEYIQ
jgi:hypothetical protein